MVPGDAEAGSRPLLAVPTSFNPENKRIGKVLANMESGSANLSATLAEARTLLADPRMMHGRWVENLDGLPARCGSRCVKW